MADETDLKSVGLYNRVGSSPMSGIYALIAQWLEQLTCNLFELL